MNQNYRFEKKEIEQITNLLEKIPLNIQLEGNLISKMEKIENNINIQNPTNNLIIKNNNSNNQKTDIDSWLDNILG